MPVVAIRPTDADLPTFDDFWTLYPKRVAKKDAVRSWSRLTDADRLQAVVALVDWRRYWLQRADERFTPHASTWLNGERWTDELPSDFVQARHASHLPAAPSGERQAMPQSVKDMLARLRK